MKYDINIKEIFEKSALAIAQILLDKKNTKIQKLPQELQIVKQLKPDFIAIVHSQIDNLYSI